MQLRNNFQPEVRSLYLGCWHCWVCGTNGQTRGGLEIHHIRGRISNSAFNSSLVCRMCHEKMCHSQIEEQTLFLRTIIYLYEKGYKPTEKDYKFLHDNLKRLSSAGLTGFINRTSYVPK